MPGFSVVDPPSVGIVRKGLLQVDYVGSTDSNLDELSFVDEQFEVVPPSCEEDFCADGGFKPTAFLGGANE